MNCVMIILKTNMATNESYHIQTLTVKSVKLKMNMSMKVLATIKKCLVSVILD